MPQLINRKHEIEDVPDGEVQSRFLSGTHAFRKGEKIPVIAPDGRAGMILSDHAQDAFAKGYSYDVGYTEKQERKQYEDRGIEAALLGAARGATLNLSDIALTKLGLVEPTTIKGIEKYNQGMSIAGEIAGVAIPAVVAALEPTPLGEAAVAPTIAGIAAKGIKFAAAPSLKLLEGGLAVERAVTTGAKALKITNPALRYTAEKIAARLASGAVTPG